jgi:hypothetical protein
MARRSCCLLAALGLAGCMTGGGTYHAGNVDGDLPNPSQAAVSNTPGAAYPDASPAIAATPLPPPTPVPPAPAPAPAVDNSDTVSAPRNFDDVEFVDDSLQGKLTVTRTGSSRTSNDLMSVFAGLRNRTAHKLEIEVETVYKDAQGNPLGEGSSWVPITLKPHQRTDYRSASLSSDAQDYLIRIRRAQPEPAPAPVQ